MLIQGRKFSYQLKRILIINLIIFSILIAPIFGDVNNTEPFYDENSDSLEDPDASVDNAQIDNKIDGDIEENEENNTDSQNEAIEDQIRSENDDILQGRARDKNANLIDQDNNSLFDGSFVTGEVLTETDLFETDKETQNLTDNQVNLEITNETFNLTDNFGENSLNILSPLKSPYNPHLFSSPLAVAGVAVTIKNDGNCLGISGTCDGSIAGYTYTSGNKSLDIIGNDNYKQFQFESGTIYNFEIKISGNNVILDGNGVNLKSSSTKTGTGIEITGDDVSVENFASINNYQTGINSTGDRSSIVDNIIYDNSYGIHLNKSNNSIIIDNIASGNGNNGIILERSDNVTITDNTVLTNSKDGIKLTDSKNATIKDNKLSYNTDYGIKLTSSDTAFIINNTVSNNYMSGIYLSGSEDSIISNNTASNNKNGIYLAYGDNITITNNNLSKNDDNGINHYYSSNSSIEGNTVLDNEKNGILVTSGDNITIKSNAVSGSPTGISFSYSNDDTITSNTVSENGKGINLSNNQNIRITGNQLANNIDTDINIGTSTGSVYNNFFESNTSIEGDITGFTFNVAPRKGKNIIGGQYIAGNYWSNPGHTGWSDNRSSKTGYTIEPYEVKTETGIFDNASLVKYTIVPLKSPSRNSEQGDFRSSQPSDSLRDIDIKSICLIIPKTIKAGERIDVEINFENYGKIRLPAKSQVVLVPINELAKNLNEFPLIYNNETGIYTLNGSFDIPNFIGVYEYLFAPTVIINGVYVTVVKLISIIITVDEDGTATFEIKNE